MVERGGEIGGKEMRVGRLRLGREAGRMLDMHRHRVDAVELARRVSGGEDRGGDPLAAAEIAPGETVLPGRRPHPTEQRDEIEPGRRQHRLEAAHRGCR